MGLQNVTLICYWIVDCTRWTVSNKQCGFLKLILRNMNENFMIFCLRLKFIITFSDPNTFKIYSISTLIRISKTTILCTLKIDWKKKKNYFFNFIPGNLRFLPISHWDPVVPGGHGPVIVVPFKIWLNNEFNHHILHINILYLLWLQLLKWFHNRLQWILS